MTQMPTLACPHCKRTLAGTFTGIRQDARINNVYVPTRSAQYPCKHCGVIIAVDVVAEEPKPETVDFGIHYVNKNNVLVPLK
jgi:hypothetical protein